MAELSAYGHGREVVLGKMADDSKESQAPVGDCSIVPEPSTPPEICCGYDCEFIDPPPAAFQTDCPVCLQILREPCVISCPCGQKLCRECVELIKGGGKPCPLCNKTDFTFIRDYGLERALKEYEVHCSYKSKGCEWSGKLRHLEEHLNEVSSLENRGKGCQFFALDCRFGCEKFFQRSVIAEHENQFCPLRPYSCPYCHEHESQYANVTETHFTECLKYPATCPNDGCEQVMERQEIEGHVRNNCPLTEVECPLHYAGCKAKLLRRYIAEHMNDTAMHLTMLATVTHNLQKENQELKHSIQGLRQENEDLKTAVHQLKEKKQIGLEETISEVSRRVDVVDLRMDLLSQSTQSLKADVEHVVKVHKLGIPVEFIVKKGGEDVYLSPFYTHSHGYQMCLNVIPKGLYEGAGHHLSLYVCLMKGQFDDHLKWPFRGSITVQIVNQLIDHGHFQKNIAFSDAAGEEFGDRVAEGGRIARGLGYPKFFPLNEFRRKPVNNTLYAKDGLIKIRVANVTLA